MQCDLVNECPGVAEVLGEHQYTRHRIRLSPQELCQYLIGRAEEWIQRLERFNDLLSQEYRLNKKTEDEIFLVSQMGAIYLEGDLSDSLVRQLQNEELACLLDDELEDGQN